MNVTQQSLQVYGETLTFYYFPGVCFYFISVAAKTQETPCRRNRQQRRRELAVQLERVGGGVSRALLASAFQNTVEMASLSPQQGREKTKTQGEKMNKKK